MVKKFIYAIAFLFIIVNSASAATLYYPYAGTDNNLVQYTTVSNQDLILSVTVRGSGSGTLSFKNRNNEIIYTVNLNLINTQRTVSAPSGSRASVISADSGVFWYVSLRSTWHHINFAPPNNPPQDPNPNPGGGGDNGGDDPDPGGGSNDPPCCGFDPRPPDPDPEVREIYIDWYPNQDMTYTLTWTSVPNACVYHVVNDGYPYEYGSSVRSASNIYYGSTYVLAYDCNGKKVGQSGTVHFVPRNVDPPGGDSGGGNQNPGDDNGYDAGGGFYFDVIDNGDGSYNLFWDPIPGACRYHIYLMPGNYKVGDLGSPELIGVYYDNIRVVALDCNENVLSESNVIDVEDVATNGNGGSGGNNGGGGNNSGDGNNGDGGNNRDDDGGAGMIGGEDDVSCHGCIWLAELLACPGWDDVMGDLTDAIRNALPPPPNWDEVADTMQRHIVPPLIDGMVDEVVPAMGEEIERVLGHPEPPPSLPTPDVPDMDGTSGVNRPNPTDSTPPAQTFDLESIPSVTIEQDNTGGIDLSGADPIDSIPHTSDDYMPMPGKESGGILPTIQRPENTPMPSELEPPPEFAPVPDAMTTPPPSPSAPSPESSVSPPPRPEMPMPTN